MILNLSGSGHDSIDIIMPNMTKGQALKRLLDKWGMSSSELMAFGYVNNHKDMLAFAKHSYVMEIVMMKNCSRLPLLMLE